MNLEYTPQVKNHAWYWKFSQISRESEIMVGGELTTTILLKQHIVNCALLFFLILHTYNGNPYPSAKKLLLATIWRNATIYDAELWSSVQINTATKEMPCISASDNIVLKRSE